MRIKDIELKHGLALAPMAGVTDKHFRRLCGEHGAEYTVTEMVSAKALCYEKLSRPSAPARSAALAEIEPGIPTAVQIFGSEPDYMAEAAMMLAEGSYRGFSGILPSAIDINMGCPVRKVVSCGEGSALMKTPDLAQKIVEAVKKSVNIPVTVKIRAGWNKDSINAPEFAKMLEFAGADAICIHGRTRDLFYAPSSDNRVIADVKSAVKIPVFGNGDIYSAKDAFRMFEETGVDGVMIARGAMGDPWLFEEIAAIQDGKEYTRPSDKERIDMALCQTKIYIEERGEHGIVETRNRLSWYVKGIKGASAARGKLNSAESFDEVCSILYSLLDNKE